MHRPGREAPGRQSYQVSPNEHLSSAFSKGTRRFRLVSVALLSVCLVALAVRSLFTLRGQALDTVAMYGVQSRMILRMETLRILHGIVSVPALVIVAGAILVTVLWRRRVALMLRLAFSLVGANVATQLVKALLERPHLEVGLQLSNSYPSGHVTLVASVGLALVAVATGRWKNLAALVAWVATVLVGISVMGLGWHRPSDVLAGILMAATFAFIALPAEWNPGGDGRGSVSLTALAWVGFAVSALGVGLVSFSARAELLLPLPAASLELLGNQIVPGGLLALFSCTLVVSVSGLAVLGVRRLTGG